MALLVVAEFRLDVSSSSFSSMLVSDSSWENWVIWLTISVLSTGSVGSWYSNWVMSRVRKSIESSVVVAVFVSAVSEEDVSRES